MIIEDPKKRTKSKKNPPDVEPRARPGTTLTTRTTRARDTLTMSAVAMSALTASKSAAIAGGAVRTKRATPAAAAPRSLVVRVSFSSLVLLARSRARTPKKSHHPSARAFAIGTSGKRVGSRGRRAVCVPTATDDARDDSNEYIFIRLPARVVARVVARVASPGRRGV